MFEYAVSPHLLGSSTPSRAITDVFRDFIYLYGFKSELPDVENVKAQFVHVVYFTMCRA